MPEICKRLCNTLLALQTPLQISYKFRTASKVNLKRGDHLGLLVKGRQLLFVDVCGTWPVLTMDRLSCNLTLSGDGSLIILLNGAPVCKGPRKAPAQHSAVSLDESDEMRSSQRVEKERLVLQREQRQLKISLHILDLHLEVLDVPLYPFVDLLGLQS